MNRRSVRHLVRACAALFAAAIGAKAAHGQIDISGATDEARCIRHIGGADRPIYPPKVLARKEGGTLDVEMTFDKPDGPPALEFSDGADSSATRMELERAVRAFASDLRVPCLPPEKRVVLKQSYHFVPHDGRSIYVERAADPDAERRRGMRSCIRRRDGEPGPSYNHRARQMQEQGNVLLELIFHAPTEPPAARVLAAPQGARSIRGIALSDADMLLMPCNDGNPIRVTRLYRFRITDDERTLLRDLPLQTLLASADNLPAGVRFDTQTMGCPFDLRLTYMQPHEPNVVLQLEPGRIERRPLADWLSWAKLRLPAEVNTQALGQTIEVNVPCAIIDY